ncbi:hypothetical protein TERMP_01243 [Thermococcus barophilus MP]|uniref:Uncharacterized protein n=1 Tax=Thermococcus barophilus (strain DSM 11836 / MP) TaxID=391623 RepID=F0LH11_THEBM|nr:hypothetical protein TERMP_01243 [Thermococcus barophilus MP]
MKVRKSKYPKSAANNNAGPKWKGVNGMFKVLQKVYNFYLR